MVATGTEVDADRLGAKSVVDHTTGSVPDQVRVAYPDGVDALIDLVAASADAVPVSVVRSGGKVASTLGAADEQALAAAGLTGSNVWAGPVRDVIGPLAEQAAAGELTIDVEQVLPFDRAAEGLATLASGRAW